VSTGWSSHTPFKGVYIRLRMCALKNLVGSNSEKWGQLARLEKQLLLFTGQRSTGLPELLTEPALDFAPVFFSKLLVPRNLKRGIDHAPNRCIRLVCDLV
jgi:hypothetical protein